jgi:hypothetical protein
MKSVLPEAVTEGGLRGYRSHDMYQDNLEKFKTMYPDIYRRIDALVNEPNNPVPASTGAVGTINPVTGMPIVPETTASVLGNEHHNDLKNYEKEAYNEAMHRNMANADTSGRYRKWHYEGDSSGYINPFDYVFGSSSTPIDELPGISQNPATNKWRL